MLAAADAERIPSLTEVAQLPSPRPFILLVELKSSDNPASADPIALADATLKVMQDQLARTIFVGFDWRGLAHIKSLMPQARCWFSTDKLQGDARAVLDVIKSAGGDGWFPHHQDATEGMIRRARARGLQVGAWTVNDPGEMSQLMGQGLDAICTDRPDILKSLEQGG
jgi:glycerophosphoryl diester phosphodiesterase